MYLSAERNPPSSFHAPGTDHKYGLVVNTLKKKKKKKKKKEKKKRKKTKLYIAPLITLNAAQNALKENTIK